jgi:hypothetical protein
MTQMKTLRMVIKPFLTLMLRGFRERRHLIGVNMQFFSLSITDRYAGSHL